MSGNSHYENLVLGCGESGKCIAWTLAKSGRRTAVIERRLIGGSCPNIACLPSKNVIHGAKVAELCRRAEEFGTATGYIRTDMAVVLKRKRNMVEGLIAMHLDKFRDSGAELIMGVGRFVAPKTIEVSLKDGGIRQLTADRVFLDLGTHATVFPVPGLADAGYITHVEALDLDRLPAHLIVLGVAMWGLRWRRRSAVSAAASRLSKTARNWHPARITMLPRRSCNSLKRRGSRSYSRPRR